MKTRKPIISLASLKAMYRSSERVSRIEISSEHLRLMIEELIRHRGIPEEELKSKRRTFSAADLALFDLLKMFGGR